MGEHEGWAVLPNGLLPNAGPLIRLLDSERWAVAEERTAELIACIQPNPPSEERRSAVADYVQRLIMKSFPCQVFTFGSVPLKTYLPDGDIDLTAFSDNQNLKETWANQVRDMLESEEKNENAEFHVKEVQYIQAEVKIIKCLVENIVVDISFNQLGGLCTLCFLDEVDHLINQNHLFKRSIILIKAWCYYESRILGAHHGLISTYALETLVLYIFHVFNNSFSGPLEVLYRFLGFFSNFDWDNFCVSLWGPVPISSLPDVTAEPPRKDNGELLLSKLFLEACSSVYAVFPGGQESQGQPFVSKHFNVIDPLRINNNLGRSVSKGNFFRIRSAFAFGAKRLARLLDCPRENLVYEINQFFMNTWDRHGSGNRPDAPRTDLHQLRLSTADDLHGSENLKNSSTATKLNEVSSSYETEADGICSRNVFSQHGNYSFERTSRTNEANHSQNQKVYGNLNSLKVSDEDMDVNVNKTTHIDKGHQSFRPDYSENDYHGKFQFSRTHSSPELTDTYSDVSVQGRGYKAPEKAHSTLRQDNNRRKNMGSRSSVNQNTRSSTDYPSSARNISSHQSLDAAVDSNSSSNSYHQEPGSANMGEEFSSVSGTLGMQQEEQDLVNMMASAALHNLNEQVHVPLNLPSGHMPFQISPSILASLRYTPRNLAGTVPMNMPLIDPSYSSMHLPQSLVSPPITHYFPSMGLTPNSEDKIDPGNENFGSVEMNPEEADHDFWQDQDVGSSGVLLPKRGNHGMFPVDDRTQSNAKVIPSSRLSGSVSSTKVQQKLVKENQGPTHEDNTDSFPYQDSRNDVYSDDRTTSARFSSAARSNSVKSRTSSESSWDGTSAKVPKSTRERRGKKTVPAEPSTMYGKGKNMSEHANYSEDEKDWNPPSTMGIEMEERISGTPPVGSSHGIQDYEMAQTSGSDSMIPISPVLLGSGLRQRLMDNSGGFPFAFYPTGPPVPFLAMIPLCNIPPETGTSETSSSHIVGEESLDNRESSQNFDSSEGPDQSEEVNTNSMRRPFVGTSNEHKSDILNSDFASHWQNLQYGRFCQNPQYHGSPLVYPSPVVVPPMYLQSHFPWDGPGRPMSANMNLYAQLMGYGPRIFPIAPLQSVSNRPLNPYQRYVDEMPRFRGGTGTYLPNPKVSVRDRHSSGSRRGNFNLDRNDYHGERENWNVNSKSRNGGRGHNRGQSEKGNSRMDRSANESRSERSWSSYRNDTVPAYHSQNGSLHSNSGQNGPSFMPYRMYSLPTMNPNGVSSNGPTVPSVVMLYPLDQNANYGTQAEQLEFGSLGPIGFPNTNEQPQLSEGNRLREAFEDQRFNGGSVQQSSPDQPSSPHFQRSVAQRNYRLKEEDFPPLAFPNQCVLIFVSPGISTLFTHAFDVLITKASSCRYFLARVQALSKVKC
ncbi:Polynucleotide adenylyltransferase [Bertholletia excelsa]